MNYMFSSIYDEERMRLLERAISADALAAYLNPNSAYKRTFDKIRAAVRPTNNDFKDAPDKHKYTVKIQQKPFLQYDTKRDTSHTLIFVSDDALRILGDT